MKNIGKTKACLALAACSALLMSCAKELPELPIYVPAAATLPTLPTLDSVGGNTDGSGATAHSQALAFVATDLVSALSYISALSPNLVSIKSPTSGTEFDELVTNALQGSGFAIDERTDRPGSEQLATAYLQKASGYSNFELTGIISINSVLIKRTYSVDGSSITPSTSYQIRGINPQLVKSSDQVHVL